MNTYKIYKIYHDKELLKSFPCPNDRIYYAKEKVSFNINSVLEYRETVVNYFNNLIDTVLNDSTSANS